MVEWNLYDHMQMKYHHMWEEGVYPEDAVDVLKTKLLELCVNNELTIDTIHRLFGGINTDYMKRFWIERAKTHVVNESMTNLEDDAELLRLKIQKEYPKMDSYVNPDKDMVMLDLGAGYGTWAYNFADQVKMVHAVDYIKDMVKIGMKRAKDENVSNVKFFESSVQDFSSDIEYDLVLLSGICLYLNDADMRQMLKKMETYTKPGTVVVLRDSTGLNARHTIEKEYSERLKTMYSATYRTRDEYIAMFKKIGFVLLQDEDMFEEGSILNRHKETRLRIYKFRRM